MNWTFNKILKLAQDNPRAAATLLDRMRNEMYFMGVLPPNYPVPSTLGEVVFDGYPNQVYINHPDGDDYFMCWDMWHGAMIIHRND